MKKILMAGTAIILAFALSACGSGDTAASQTRGDLTSDHFMGLTSGMDRKDVEDLVGAGDESLGKHESLQTYGLADGTTAILRYWNDKLVGAYIRGKDAVETSLFDKLTKDGADKKEETEKKESTDPAAEHITGETMKEEAR